MGFSIASDGHELVECRSKMAGRKDVDRRVIPFDRSREALMSLSLFPSIFVARRRVRRSSRSERLSRLLRQPMVEGLEVRITPSTDVWTGAAALASQDFNWSNASNWSQGVPQTGEDLQFPVAGANNFIPTQPINNDLSGETFGSIEIDSAGYTIAGNAISLTAATGIFTTYTSGTSSINLNTTLSGTDITVAAGGELDLNGVVSDANGLTTTGGGILGGTGQLPALAVQSNQVFPGIQGVGTLTVNGTVTFAQSSTYSVTLAGQQQTNELVSTLDTTPSVSLNSATLQVSLAPGFTPAPGIGVTIIQGNVVGAFNGLPQGTTFSVDGTNFTISYQHGVVLTAAKASSTTQTSGPGESVFGQSVTLTATVTGAGGTPAGLVTFEDGGTELGTGNLNSSGVATFTTSDLGVGENAITAVYAGNNTFAGSTSPVFDQNVTPAFTTASITSLANPAVVGQSVTLVANIAANLPSSATPTGGMVTFMDGTTTLGSAPLNTGMAVFTTSALLLGQNSLSATYGGDAAFNGSESAPLSQVVDQSSTDTTVTSSAIPGVFGQSLTFTAQVLAVSPGTGTPTGSIIFKDGTTTIGSTPLTAGVATLSISSLGLGDHSITAVYNGDANYLASTSAMVTQVVDQASTTTVLTSLPESSFLGESVTFVAQVSAVSPGSGTPTGSVMFMDGTTELGTSDLSSGAANFSTTGLTLGTHSITAVYTGDADFTGSTSSPSQQLVGGTSTALSSSANPSNFGQSVTFTATVTESATGGSVPAGTVTFMDGTTDLGHSTLNNAAVATFSTTALSGGSNSITAVYGGDAESASSTSSAIIQVVNQASTSTTVTSSVNASVFGQSVTLTATVGSGAGTPTGTVAFEDGTTVLGTVSLGASGVATFSTNGLGVGYASGVATFSTNALDVGPHSLVAVYSGSDSYESSQSSQLAFSVNQAATTISLSSSASTPGVGQNVTFAATVAAAAPGAGIPSGVVAFYDGSTAIGTAPVTNGQAMLSTTFSAVGTGRVITATYLGSGSFLTSTSAGQTQNVVQGTPTITFIATPVFRGSTARRVTLQIVVQPENGGAPVPTGTIVFQSNGRKIRSRALVGGTASVVLTKAQASGRTFTVRYRGDTDYKAGISNRIRLRPSFFRTSSSARPATEN
jgi:Bacterial Ig-like domain (group 3)